MISQAGERGPFGALLQRDLLLAYRHRAELGNPLMFFIVVVTLFPLAIGPESNLLQRMAPGMIWVAALLSALLSLDNLFRSDFEDGALEQLAVSGQPLSMLVLAKVSAHWLVTGLPLLLLAPWLGVWLYLPFEANLALLATLALGTPVLSLIGAIGVALTVGLRRGGILLALLVLPLYIPLLIFGAGAVDAAATGISIGGQLALLGAILLLALVLAPLATAAALRISLS